MHIIELRAENIKRLMAVAIKPDGALITVAGRNGQGKTSLLDSIAYALGGKDLMPAKPLRHGTSHGEVEIRLDDGTVIKRSFTPGGGVLTVSNRDGARYSSPQKLLDSLVGKLSFDPLAFARMDPKDQVQTLRSLVGLDFSEIDTRRQTAYDKRTETNREVKRLEGAISKLPPPVTDAPAEEISVRDLASELETRRAYNADLRNADVELENLRKHAVSIKEGIASTEKMLAELRAKLEAVTAEGKEKAAKRATRKMADESEIMRQIENSQAINATVRAMAERKRLTAEIKTQLDQVGAFTAVVQKCDDEKCEKLSAATMPIDGLGFTDADVTLAGLPLDQASSAEQLRASVAIGLAMHSKLKIMLIRDGSLLDESSLRMVAEMADKAKAQVWLEKVSETGDGCSIVIEDGMVKSAVPREREPGEDG